VCRIVATRGEDYLRIKHCDPEELRSDIIKDYSEEIVRELRAQLAADVKKITKLLLTRSRYIRYILLEYLKVFPQLVSCFMTYIERCKRSAEQLLLKLYTLIKRISSLCEPQNDENYKYLSHLIYDITGNENFNMKRRIRHAPVTWIGQE